MASSGYIEDRWLTKRPDPKTGQRRRTGLWGTKTKRYRVAGIPGVRSRSFESAADAKAWLKQASTDVARGDFYDPRSGQITLRTYVEHTWWPTLRMPPTTKEAMRSRIFNHILPHMGSKPLASIGADEIKWWVSRVEQDIDAGTVRVIWRHFSKIMQAAATARRIPINPFRDEEIRKLAPKAPKSTAVAWPCARVVAVRAALSPRYRILVDEGVGAGLRQGEAFGLSPADVDGEVIHVRRQVVKVGGKLAFAPPKGNKTRDAPCPPELAAAIAAHGAEFPAVEVTLPWVDPDRPNLPWEERPLVTVLLIVTTARGAAVNRTTFDGKHWKPALVRAGVIPEPEKSVVERPGQPPLVRVAWKMPRQWGFHGLRHTFASVVLAAGETIAKLAQWLGHHDPAFTLRTYIHFLPDAGSRGIAALGAWLSPQTSADAETPSELPQPAIEGSA